MGHAHSPQFVALVNAARSRIRECSVQDVQGMLLGNDPHCHLFDVRDSREFEAGHLPGAVHLCCGVLERDVERLVPDPGERIVLYCGGGYRSALAADNLQKMGFTQVTSMWGGFTAWSQAGLAIES